MKSFLKDYQVNELAQFYGISSDAVRLYDKKGILVPRKNNVNHYRQYNREDIIMMEYVMRLKKMEFSLEEICKIVNDVTIGETVDMLQAKEEEMEAKIREMCLLKEMTADFKESVKSISENEGKFLIKDAPAFICRKIDETAQKTMEGFARLELGTFPIMTIHPVGWSMLDENCSSMLLERKSRVGNTDLYLSAKDNKGIHKRPGFPHHEFEVIPPRKSLYLSGRVRTNGDYAVITRLANYVKEQGIQVRGEPLVRLISILENKTESTDFYEYWTPIE